MKKTTSLGLVLLLATGLSACKSKVKEAPASPAAQKKEFSKSLPTFTQAEFDQDKQNLESAQSELRQLNDELDNNENDNSHELKIEKYEAIINAYNIMLDKYSSKFRFENDEDGKYRYLTTSTEELTKQRDAFVALKNLAIKLREQQIAVVDIEQDKEEDREEEVENDTEADIVNNNDIIDDSDIIIEDKIPTQTDISVTQPKYDYYEIVNELNEIEKTNIALRTQIVSLGQSVHQRENETDLRAFTQGQDEKIIADSLKKINFLNAQNKKYEDQKKEELKKIEEGRWTISSWANSLGYDSLADDKKEVTDKYDEKIQRNISQIDALTVKVEQAQKRYNDSVAFVADTASSANKKLELEADITKNLERAVELRLILESGEFHVGQRTEINLEDFQKEVQITKSILESLPKEGTQFNKKSVSLSTQTVGKEIVSCFIQVDSIEEIEKLDMLTGTITVKTNVQNVKLTSESAQGCVHDTEMIGQGYSTDYHFRDIVNRNAYLEELVDASSKTVKILKKSNRRYEVVSINTETNKESITEVNLLESMVHDFFITNKEVKENGTLIESQKVERILE